MKRTHRKFEFTASLLVVFVLVLAACAPAAVQEPTLVATEVPAPTMEATEALVPTTVAATEPIPETGEEGANIKEQAVVEVSENDELGSFLVDEEGMVLYLFTKDEPDKSNCSGDCLVKWPPLLTRQEPQAGEGVDASKLGAIPFEGDLMLVTYDGAPLYYWYEDTAPGDTNGQGVGDVWFVVSPEGVGSMESSGGEAVETGAAQVMVSQNDELGEFLVDGEGMTLYLFTNDEPNKSNCAGECLVNWPPFLTTGDPVAGEGVDAAKLGTIPFEGDQLLVTYDGAPLYYWKNDKAAGDTTGQGVGDVWYVVAP